MSSAVGGVVVGLGFSGMHPFIESVVNNTNQTYSDLSESGLVEIKKQVKTFIDTQQRKST